MRKAFRWLGFGVLGLLVLAGLAVAGLHLYTETLLRVEPHEVEARLPQGDAARGARLAKITGCRGCHDDDLSGGVLFEEPYVFRIVAPNLTRERARYDDAAFLQLFRTGAKADGELAIAMPLVAMQRMTDQEVADLLAFIRSVPEVDEPDAGPTRLYPLARLGIATGELPAEDIKGDPPESTQVLAQRNTTDRGEHIAMIACTECHGRDLNGDNMSKAPPLLVAKGYSLENFARLLKTGKTNAGVDSATGLMSGVARDRFSLLDAEEVEDLHQYLLSR